MKANEIRDLATSEIELKVKSLKEELFNLLYQLFSLISLSRITVFIRAIALRTSRIRAVFSN